MHHRPAKEGLRQQLRHVNHLLLHHGARNFWWSDAKAIFGLVRRIVRVFQADVLRRVRRRPGAHHHQLVAHRQVVGAGNPDGLLAVGNRGAAKQGCLGADGHQGPPLLAHQRHAPFVGRSAARAQLRRDVVQDRVPVEVLQRPPWRDPVPVDLQRCRPHLWVVNALGADIAHMQAHVGRLDGWRADGVARLKGQRADAVGNERIAEPCRIEAQQLVVAARVLGRWAPPGGVHPPRGLDDPRAIRHVAPACEVRRLNPLKRQGPDAKRHQARLVELGQHGGGHADRENRAGLVLHHGPTHHAGLRAQRAHHTGAVGNGCPQRPRWRPQPIALVFKLLDVLALVPGLGHAPVLVGLRVGADAVGLEEAHAVPGLGPAPHLAEPLRVKHPGLGCDASAPARGLKTGRPQEARAAHLRDARRGGRDHHRGNLALPEAHPCQAAPVQAEAARRHTALPVLQPCLAVSRTVDTLAADIQTPIGIVQRGLADLLAQCAPLLNGADCRPYRRPWDCRRRNAYRPKAWRLPQRRPADG